MAAYYNEIDPYAAQWLRNLIAAGHIAAGDVDERSIEDVTPDDIRNYTQCHFFAGIGVWSYALRRAGWSDDKPVWTGSCPCQPFSAAGQGGGFDDERHLWPHFHYLIEQCRPRVVFGEQVASKDGLGWFDLVQADLEGAKYAATAIDICAAGVGAPHIRQRLYWVANTNDTRLEGYGGFGQGANQERWEGTQRYPWSTSMAGGMEYADMQCQPTTRNNSGTSDVGGTSEVIWLANSDNSGQQPGAGPRSSSQCPPEGDNSWWCGTVNATAPTNGFWRDADWLSCRDGKWRPVEPSTFPLANGITARVGRLRAYGNAICAEVAETFIGSYMASQEQK